MIYRNIIVIIGYIILSVSSTWAGVYTLRPHVSISEEYTDNRNLSDKNPIEEYITTISPGLDQSIVGKRLGLDLTYSASYVLYNKTDADPIWNHNATLDFRGDLSKHTQLSIVNSFTRTDKPLYRMAYNLLGYVLIGDHLVPIVDTTMMRGREQYDTNTALARLTHQFGEKDRLSLSYSHRYIRELESEYGINNQQHTAGMDITYWLTSHFGVDIFARYVGAELENSDDYSESIGGVTLRRKLTKHLDMYLSYNQTLHRYDNDIQRDYDLHKSAVGLSYEFDKDIVMSLGGGYYYQDMKETGDDDEGPFADISIRKTWSSDRSNTSLFGKVGLATTNFGSEDLGFNRHHGVGISYSYKMTKRMDLNIRTSFSNKEFLDKDNLMWNSGRARCGLRFTPWSWMSVSASYSFNYRDSTRETDNFQENTAMLSVSIFPWTYRNNY